MNQFEKDQKRRARLRQVARAIHPRLARQRAEACREMMEKLSKRYWARHCTMPRHIEIAYNRITDAYVAYGIRGQD